jgi:putative DNA primase/helicase
MTNSSLIESFKQAARSVDLESIEVIADGMLHRFTVAGDRAGSNSGWYVFHTDEPAAGAFGCWKRGISEIWCSKAFQSMNTAEKTAYVAKIEAMKRQRDDERQRIHAECRAWCTDVWNNAEDATGENPYLKRKGVQAYGLKSFKDSLIIPVQDMAGTIHGLQFIAPDGSKKFKTGTDKVGHFFEIGKNKGEIVVCEGFATGASIRQATRSTIFVAFDAGNLLVVAQKIRSSYPGAKIIFAADDDYATEGNPGLTKATEAAKAVNGFLAVPVFPNTRGPKDTDFNDLARIATPESVRACIDGAVIPNKATPADVNPATIDPLWGNAQSDFPYQEAFPWGIFPPAIADSLLACAESCATSPTALAGTAFAILASGLGKTVNISPKSSWIEPLHVWFADIRPSGEGKTPAMQLLAYPLHQAQAQSDAEFETAKEIWEQSDKNTKGAEPKWNRSYFVSGLTLEGVRVALQDGHGGLVCLLNELSSFITGQGQYKSGKGDDREAWLALHDGSPARILRAGNSLTIPASRVSICGGIQPDIFRSVFGDKKGLFLTDGTIFRFLLTYEHSGDYELTRATWSDQHRAIWESIISRSLQWADNRFKSGSDPLVLKLTDDAWDYFSGFRNSTYSNRDYFPPSFRGFIPKAAAYVLRLAGLLHVFEQFSTSDEINPVINQQTIEKAILAVRFYLGHTLEALKLLKGEQPTMIQRDQELHNLVSVLRDLFGKAEVQGFITAGAITARLQHSNRWNGDLAQDGRHSA